MSRHLQKDVDVIHHRLLTLFGVVEQMIDKAVRALCEQKVDLAAEVIATDHEVNQAEVEIEEECLKILALHQPVALTCVEWLAFSRSTRTSNGLLTSPATSPNEPIACTNIHTFRSLTNCH